MNFKEKINNIVNHLFEVRLRNSVTSANSRNMRGLKLVDLSKDESLQVKAMWGLRDMKYHRMFKTFDRFDVRYVSDASFVPRILRALNPIDLARVFEQKALYGQLYDGIPQPKCLLRSDFNGGGWYIIGNQHVGIEEAIATLRNVEKFIIKPTHDSEQGRNVKLINTNKDDVNQVIRDFGCDFIVQEVIEQSDRTALFHKESLNTFRISTLNINGRSSLCNILFRCGQGKSVVDNGFAGGLMIGVKLDGSFMEYAYDKFFNKYQTTSDGVRFCDQRIDEMPQIVNQLLKWHSEYLPFIGFVGWDIALNREDKPIMIEVNLRGPGIQFEQLCSETPLFGNRTDEVIEFVKGRSLKLIEFVSI